MGQGTQAKLIEPSKTLKTPEGINEFVFAGSAIFTIQSKRTGKRFTFKMQKPKGERDNKDAPWFVMVLSGGDNTTDYQYFGFTDGRTKKFRHGGSKTDIDEFEWK